ncbi:MAG TPA: hypothetical protein VEK79_13955 [Thermoanaerobaculia bacterium]|nr:hypothetical protein [Thermoanaerobaculia bacterium]
MARPRKSGAASSTRLTGGQAAYVLERMLKERRVNQSDVNRYISEMSAEIGQLEERLRHLRDAVGGAASAAASGIASVAATAVAAVRRRGPGRPKGSGRGPGRPAGSGRGPGRPPRAASTAAAMPAAGASASTASKGGKRGRKTPITTEQLASRQLQGRYLSLVRRFPANRRAAFAKTAKEKGREAAIREMQSSLPSGSK